MKDPYIVLGVSRDATNDEIKKVYRKLCRQYHPDANIDNPNKAQAEEKFKEIGEAYRSIMDQRSGKSTDSFSSSYSSDYQDSRLRAASAYIQRGYFREAINTLNSITERNAMWYYLSAIANARVGNNIMAREYAKTAYSMEPNNPTYARLYEAMSGESGYYRTYRTTGTDYGRSVNIDTNYCIRCCAANLILNLCCGGRFFFC